MLPHYVESHSFSPDNGDFVVGAVFLAKYAGGEPTIVDVGEVAEITWMSADEVLSDVRSPIWTRELIAKVERKRQELGW